VKKSYFILLVGPTNLSFCHSHFSGLSAAVGVGSGGALYLVSAYVVMLVIMILRYAPRSYLIGLDEEEEEEVAEAAKEEQEEAAENENERTPENNRPVSGDHAGRRNGREDMEDDEAMDMLSAIPRSNHGLEQHDYLVPVARSSSNQMIKSKSTPSLRASVRARVPTFAE
jgi:uncharacterized membrane protein YhiD involved in acid resistance